MPDQTVPCTYFERAGVQNSEKTLELAKERAKALEIEHIVVASTSGETGALAAEMLNSYHVVVVTHSTGFQNPNHQQLEAGYRERIKAANADILTCQHALGGIGRAARRKLGTYQLEEIMAFTLRNFCEGIKVVCEITVMAADAGLIPAGEEIIAVGGTGQGADTAAVMLSANAQDFFDLRVLEILCKPRCWQ
ncbi:MAG: pyruvate kinase alpha/beta domain-containing protein [Chloroflexota bacterium]|nr:pyruvate kinase alpha/beta domain-containing protein [Chloroflexota bacterium]